jgi:hypothetical protein
MESDAATDDAEGATVVPMPRKVHCLDHATISYPDFLYRGQHFRALRRFWRIKVTMNDLKVVIQCT